MWIQFSDSLINLRRADLFTLFKRGRKQGYIRLNYSGLEINEAFDDYRDAENRMTEIMCLLKECNNDR